MSTIAPYPNNRGPWVSASHAACVPSSLAARELHQVTDYRPVARSAWPVLAGEVAGCTLGGAVVFLCGPVMGASVGFALPLWVGMVGAAVLGAALVCLLSTLASSRRAAHADMLLAGLQEPAYAASAVSLMWQPSTT